MTTTKYTHPVDDINSITLIFPDADAEPGDPRFHAMLYLSREPVPGHASPSIRKGKMMGMALDIEALAWLAVYVEVAAKKLIAIQEAHAETIS